MPAPVIKDLYRVWDAYLCDWVYVNASSKEIALNLARRRVLAKIGKYNLTALEKRGVDNFTGAEIWIKLPFSL